MKRENSEFVRTGKGFSYAGFLTVAMGLLFSSEILWSAGNGFPTQSVITGVFCIIAGAGLVVYGRRKNAADGSDTNAKRDT
ncbi:MAG: hypothetical protein K2K44_08275 [Oscillospiraceae bacterium]|nr:hypothetical protein [Oscillospiraceae bacterium]